MSSKMRNIQEEMMKIKVMVKDKLLKQENFVPMVVALYNSGTNEAMDLEKWRNNRERDIIIGRAISWLKSKNPMGVILASLTSKKKYASKEDMENKRNPQIIPSVMVIGRTSDKCWSAELEYGVDEGRLSIMRDVDVQDRTNDLNSFLDDVYRNIQ